MKKIDYYAVQNPWRMPKWLGATLGVIFSIIAIGSVAAIVQLTRSPAPSVAAVAAAPAIAPVAAPSPAPAEHAVAAVASAEETAAPAAVKHHGSKRHGSHGKPMKLASAKRIPASSSSMDQGRRTAMLAKHDSKDKRHEKDALDKLLGL